MEAPTHHRAVALALAAILALGLARFAPQNRAADARGTDAGVSAEAGAAVDASVDALRIDPNRATQTALETLPGVGPVLAARIVAAREAGARFRSADDLRQAHGVGARTAARLAPYLAFPDVIDPR